MRTSPLQKKPSASLTEDDFDAEGRPAELSARLFSLLISRCGFRHGKSDLTSSRRKIRRVLLPRRA